MGAKVAAGGVLAMLALSGCSATETPSPVASSPSPTPTPLFANEREALAAATKAYEAYQDMSNQIAAEGGVAPERMNRFAAGEVLRAEVKSLRGISERHLRAVGELKFDSLTLREANLDRGIVSSYLCLDVSGTDLLDENGKSIVPSSRRSRLPLAVTFTYFDNVQKLMVTGSEIWAGKDFCQSRS